MEQSMALTARTAKLNVAQMTARMREQGLALFGDLQAEHGDLVRLRVLPGLAQYLVFSPALTYQYLVQEPERFRKPELGRRLLRDSFGNGLFFSEGDFWRRQRKLAQPAFHHARIKGYAEQMVAQAARHTASWTDGAEIDLEADMRALTLINVVSALFRSDISGEVERVAAAMKTLGEVTGTQVASPLQLLLPGWWPSRANQRKKEAIAVIDAIIYRLIAERRASADDKGDLLSMFLAARDEESGESMSDQQVRDELMTMFIAGHETSATALAWALVELARNPAALDALTAEVDAVCGGRLPTPADLPQMPLVTGTVKETLRLYPPTLFITRQPAETFELGGARVRKNDLLTFVSAQMHRDARWFAAPDAFQPERWAGDFERSLPKGIYTPFGTGPRICIGNGFAQLQMALVLATFVGRCRFHLSPDARVQPKLGIALGFAAPVRMRVEQRAAAN